MLFISGLILRWVPQKVNIDSKPDSFSKTGTHSSSVAPGYTVDS
jgi:hypothetical protein